MSQEKVERYKLEKANRKQILKKEKAKATAARIGGIVICVAFIGWIGYSGYTRWQAAQPAKTTEVTVDALTEYMNGLSADAETDADTANTEAAE